MKQLESIQQYNLTEEGLDNQLIKDRLVYCTNTFNPFDQTTSCQLTESRITIIIAEQLKGVILHCEIEKTWYIWQKMKWVQDNKNEIKKIVQTIITRLMTYATMLENKNERDKIIDYLRKCENQYHLKNIIELLKAELPVTPDEFDSQPWLINCQNGILNLESMILLPHDSKFKMTKIINCIFDDSATCPEWEKFLLKVFLTRNSIIEYLQRVLGLSLVGEIIEHILILLYGRGANGKTTLLNTITQILGDYADSVPVETFLSSKFDNTRFNSYLLVGKRLITTIEPDKHKYLKEGTIKQLTGGDSMKAEKKFCMPFSFKPQCIPFLACNVKPKITGQDHGIWRRIKAIPFDYQFTESEKIPNFEKILLKEKEGIFLWMITGLLQYQNDGLRDPEIIKKVVEDYKNQEDILSDFFDSYCILTGEIQARELYQKYKEWVEKTCEKRSFSEREFSLKLIERGYEKKRRSKGYFYQGISLKM